MPRFVDAGLLQPTAAQKFLLDANVWLDLVHSDPRRAALPRAGAYAGLLRRIHRAGARVLVNFVVLSELVNRIARLEFDVFRKQRPLDYKRDFRDQPAFASARTAIDTAIRGQVLPQSSVAHVPGFALAPVVDDFLNLDVDVNDAALAKCCEAEGALLVTHDADFGRVASGIEVATANPRLLTQR